MPYVDCITGHPMVKLYQAQPAALVVSHLARFEMKEAKVDIAKMANTVSGLAERIDTIKASNPEDRMEAVKEFTEYARDSVVSEDWCYDLVVGAKEGLSETLQEVIPDDQIRREAEEALALLDMTREEFTETATAVLDFASHVLENELIEKATAGELSQIPEETVTMLGGILNQNETILSLKKYVVESVVEEVFVHSYGENPTDADWKNRAKTDSQDFVNRYFGTGKVSESERNSEAEAFLSLLSSGSEESVRDAISRHPLFGDSAVADLTRLGILSPAA